MHYTLASRTEVPMQLVEDAPPKHKARPRIYMPFVPTYPWKNKRVVCECIGDEQDRHALDAKSGTQRVEAKQVLQESNFSARPLIIYRESEQCTPLPPCSK
jgi:hypothetical protein